MKTGAIVLALAALFTACSTSSPAPTTACVNFTTRACSCEAGPESTQTCRADGTYGACDCGGGNQGTFDAACNSTGSAVTCPELRGNGVSRQTTCVSVHTPNTPHDEFNHCVFYCVTADDGGTTPDNDATALCHTLGGQCVSPGAGALEMCVK